MIRVGLRRVLVLSSECVGGWFMVGLGVRSGLVEVRFGCRVVGLGWRAGV